jgi:alpha-galactosidase
MMCEKPNLPKEPIFGVNNWYWAYGEITHDSVLDECDYLMEMAADATCRPHMIIDDGWQLNRYANRFGSYNGGPWDKTNGGFTDMARTADEIHARGARAGIWMRPLLTCLPVPHEAVGIRKANGGGTILDPSHPYTLALVREDVARIRSWGYDLIKHDFTTMDTVNSVFEVNAGLPAFYDKHHPTAYIMRELYRTIEEAAGGANVIGCNTFGHLVAGIHSVQRVGDDTSGRNFEITRGDGVGTLVRLPQNNTFFSHDPDCAAFTAMVSHERNLDFLQAAAITGATTLASVTPHTLSAESMARIRGIYKTASEGGIGAIPADWLGHREPADFVTEDGRRFVFDWYSDYLGVRQFYTWNV